MNPIAFSTLACPHWQAETVIAKATEFGYDGIEWRGGPQGHVQPDMHVAQKAILQKRLMDTGLITVAVTAYTSFVSSVAKERQSNIDELKRYADLAAELDAPYVRTFLGELPEGTKPDPSIYQNISDCLNIACEYAESVGVKITIEPHDDFVRAASIVPILNQIQNTTLRVIWDIGNAFAAGEDPAESFALLKDRLAYVQVKDGKGRDPNWQLCSLGRGDVPLGQAFELLMANNYEGAFSVEWEYAWHPELDPPEMALPAALRTVQELLAAAQPESA
jgi:sugar phosphate isomerase/epimerase